MHFREILDEVRRIIVKHAKPERIYLYGSRATGEATETSDIDIAYYDKEFRENYLIEEEVRQLPTLLKIDVKNIAFAEERFRNRVNATGRVIYSFGKKQRCEDGIYNFRNALYKYADVVDRKEEFYREGFSDIYLDLVVKRFEFTYEMAWKAVKRYLDYVGIECTSPRSCFKEAFAQKIIGEDAIWLEMIEQRNLTSHVYDESEVAEILGRIVNYKNAFAGLLETLELQLKDGQ
ncbi:MAG: HI0074 family nucleotidyltransferase substrate-binding subunit [Geobacteraceae bacterium]|nr:HI0074 family nucleotidyltransferase substrate-binding subunit [Geobacteraceae bacterium]